MATLKRLVKPLLIVLVVILGLVGACAPCYEMPVCVLWENELLVERTNHYNKRLYVDVAIRGEDNKMKKEVVCVEFEGDEEHYRFSQQYFQEKTGSQNPVLISTKISTLRNKFLGYTFPVCVSRIAIYLGICAICFYLGWNVQKKE